MKVENVADYLKGPTVVAMAKQDSNEVAKVLFDFAKDTPALSVKGASIANEIFDAGHMNCCKGVAFADSSYIFFELGIKSIFAFITIYV